ncbi:MAG: helicase-associated domain-containing protein [Acidimicrobiales bacterium]
MGFAEHLRSWSAEDLAGLFTARPDLLPASDRGFGAVARKAATPLSLGRCLVRADVGMLVVAEALAVAEVASADELDELLGTRDVAGVIDALRRLERQGVVVIEEGVARPVGALGDLLHRPLGLGPSFVELAVHTPPSVLDGLADAVGVDGASSPSATARAVARRLRDPSVVARLLEGAAPTTGDLLDALVGQRSPAVGLPTGHLYRAVDRSDPLAWLLATGLLVAVNDGLAELPREVVIASRPGGLAPGAALRPIGVVAVDGVAADEVTAVAAERAARTLEGAEAVLRRVERGEVDLRKSGGVGVRELRRVGREVDLDPADVGRLLELLHDARLINPVGAAVVATELAPRWWGLARPIRWAVLVRAWHASPSFASRVLSTEVDGSPLPALGQAEPVAAAHAGRLAVLDAIASLPPGAAYDPHQLTEAVVWRSPNLWGTGEPPPETLVGWTLDESTLLGLTACDAPTPILRALASGRHADLEHLAEGVLGHDQAQVVLQTDLTAVALGPLDPTVAGSLGDLADRQSGSSVPTYRFSDVTIRRAFDRGWTAETARRFLTTHALSGVPQPLDYLIDDVARRYGSVRVLAATAVIVADDEATAVEIASTVRAARLGLRLVAPTVLIGPAEPHRLVDELRAEGLFPVLDGETVVLRGGSTAGDDELGDNRPPLPADWTGPALTEAALAGEVADAVDALRADDTPPVDVPVVDRRLHLLWNRPAVIRSLRNGELVEARGIVVGVGETVTLLNEAGIEEVPASDVVSVEDPTR